MSNFLKRIQRDRDEQVLCRKNDSKILIKRHRNMLKDMNQRHVHEYKRTVDFLKYALSNHNVNKTKPSELKSVKSVISVSMLSPRQSTTMSIGPSGIKARHHSLQPSPARLDNQDILPAIPGA